MATATAPSYAQITRDISTNNLSPVYILHGVESFFTDQLVKKFEQSVPEAEKDFNCYVLYAPDTAAETIVSTCQRLPFMADRQMVIVKECHEARADQLNKLSAYLESPNPTTTLVLVFRGTEAKGKNLLSAAKKSHSIIHESKKLRERDIDAAISTIAKDLHIGIEPKSTILLREHLGTDLAKINNEIHKISLAIGQGATITPETVEEHVGISKDYNNFELVSAIARRNATKAFSIVKYFKQRPKTGSNSAISSVASLFNYFSALLTAHFTPDKSPRSLMNALGLRWEGQLADYNSGLRSYNAFQAIEIISLLRKADANMKGIGSRMNEYDLLHSIIFKILIAQGDIRFND